MSSRDKTLIAVLALIVVAVGGYFLVVQPEHRKANHLESQINSEKADLAKAEQTVSAGELAEAQYRTYEAQFKSIAAAVPGDAQIPELINELQAASNKTKVSFQAVAVAGGPTAPAAPSTGTAAITFPSQSFTLSFTGSYFAVANLLGKLSSFVQADDTHFHATGRLVSISSVAESAGGTGTATATSGSGVVTATVNALDYDLPSATVGSSTTS